MGDRRARRGVRARLADRRLPSYGSHRAVVGWRRAHAGPAPRHLLDQLAVPLLRAPPVRHEGRVAEPAVAGDPVVRRVVAQQPPRLPDLGRARHAQLADRHLGDGDPRAGEAGARLGRRSRQPGAAGEARASLEHRPRCATRSRARCPTGRSASSCGTARRCASTDGGPDVLAALAAGARPRPALARPARRRPRLRVAARSTSTTWRARSRCWTPGARRRSTRATAARIAAAAVRAGALRSVPHVPDAELRPRGRRHSVARDRRSVRHHYDVSNEFFELFLGESMTYSCAIFSRGATTLEEAQETKLELVCTKLGLRARGCACSTSAAAGAASRCTPRRATACTSPASRCRSRRRRAPASGPRRRASPTGSRSACRTTASSAASASTRSPRSAWSSTSARSTSTPTRSTLVDALEPGGRAAQPRHRAPAPRRPRGGRVLRALRVPRRGAAAPVADRVGVREDGLDDRPRRGLRARLRGDAAPLGARGSTTASTRRPRLAGPERVRVWRLYLRAARRGFETGFTSVYQVRARA